MRSLAWLLTLLASAWLLLIAAAPIAAGGVHLSAATYLLGSAICHQRPDRSFHVDAAQLPVCARCTGVYVGAAAGAWLALRRWNRRWSWRTARTATILAAVPTAISLAFEHAGIVDVANVARAMLAVPLGAAVAASVTATANGLLR